MSLSSFLSRERTVAPIDYNRWLFPPAALAIHLCIGQAYALSVFNIPLSKIIGAQEGLRDATGDIISAPDDWPLTTTVWIFNIAFFFLGVSAALFGKWLERVGPRKAMFVSACCFCGGFLISALGIYIHQITLLYLGYGVLGGIGLGLGYISPVSTLIKWFPDRPGMATGMAIMGFGGGAMIGSPLAVELMNFFTTETSVGVMETFIAMGLIYFVFMLFGVFRARIPAEGWKPKGYVPAANNGNKMITTKNVLADNAMKTPQFWFLWIVLCCNVTAGIGVLAQASPMIQDMFLKPKLAARGLSAEEIAVSAAATAGGFVAMLSFFNLIGRFFWSSFSDYIGRKNTYTIYLLLGGILYFSIPTVANLGSIVIFVIIWCVILTMYGGGFSTIPAYLKDLFGTKQVGAIHGRLLTAWSVAALLGPTIVTQLRSYQIDTLGLEPKDAYSKTMYIMAGFLVIGLIANLLVRPVNSKYQEKSDQ